MGLFDRRKDAKEPSTSEPAAAAATGEQALPPTPAAEPGQPEPPPSSTGATDPAPAPAASSKAIHTVAAGESLADLAGRYGVPAEEIARQNHLPPSGSIHAGQVFVIEGARA